MLDVLGEAALRTVLLAGAAQGILWLLRVRQARLLLAAWTAVLVASATMPLLLLFTPLRVPLDPAVSRVVVEGGAELLQHSLLQVVPGDVMVEVGNEPSTRVWLEAVYVAVVSCMILRIVIGLALSLRILAQAVSVRPAWAEGLRVRISRNLAGPVTIGRVVVFPTDVVDWPAETQRAVLAHEQAHVERWDFAMLVVSQLNRAVFWFSPLSWWLHRRLVALAELASDDQAIAAFPDRLRYAEILLEMGRRPGPLPRGLAMARLSTLPHRIDRILLDQALPPSASLPQHGLLMVAVAGLALAAASPVSRSLPIPAVTLLEPYSVQSEQRATGPMVQGGLISDAPSEPAFPQLDPSPAAMAEPPSPARPTSRSALLTPAKSAPLPRLQRVMERPSPINIGHGEGEDLPRRQALGTDAVARTVIGSKATISAPPHTAAQGNAGGNCTGTLAVGPAVWRSATSNQPDVAAGQQVAMRALFFRKQDGATWVRFAAFDRPPLDLPVGRVRDGITWTGEYGISYTVRSSGENRLVGLAARVLNDSAILDFNCTASVTHLF